VAAAVVRSGRLAQGAQAAGLERELSGYVGHREGIAVSSGTAALYCALKALGVGKGGAVVVPSYVCAALLHAVCAAGASAVLADVDGRSGNCTVETVRKALRRKVKAIIVPHLFGNPAPAHDIERCCGVPVIEDCAQCVGATIDGKPVGSLTTLSVFSMYATKVLAAGEGGMVATSDSAIARAVKDIREYDNRDDFRQRFNFKMSDMHAAVAREQLKKIDRIVRRRRAIAARYDAALEAVMGTAALPPRHPAAQPMYFRYVVRMRTGAERIISFMNRHGICCSRPVYKPLHRYLRLGGFPGTETIYRQAVSIPIYPGLSENEIRTVLRTFRTAVCGSV